MPAFQHAIEESRKNIDAITSSNYPPNFNNTIEALEFSSLGLERISSIFFNLNAAETSPEIQTIAQEVSPLLTAFSNDVALNHQLFKRIKAVYDQKETLNLNDEQYQLLDKKYKSFIRNGANLKEKDQENLRRIDKELSSLKLTFGENLLSENNLFRLHVEQASDLVGLPKNVVESAKILAKKENKNGWLFTLDYPSYVPFMTYCKNRDLRKTMAVAFGQKGFHDNALDNQDLVLKIAKLRHQRANLLGYPTHAHYVLEERMAKTPEIVLDFLQELKAKAYPSAIQDRKSVV